MLYAHIHVGEHTEFRCGKNYTYLHRQHHVLCGDESNILDLSADRISEIIIEYNSYYFNRENLLTGIHREGYNYQSLFMT